MDMAPTFEGGSIIGFAQESVFILLLLIRRRRTKNRFEWAEEPICIFFVFIGKQLTLFSLSRENEQNSLQLFDSFGLPCCHIDSQWGSARNGEVVRGNAEEKAVYAALGQMNPCRMCVAKIVIL